MLLSVTSTFLFATLAVAVPAAPAKRQLAEVIYGCTNPNQVALTFDDGPYIYTKNISNQLTAAGAKGTFFVNGNNWDCIYSDKAISRLKHAYDRGHQIASHTWSHDDLATLTWDEVHDQMWRVEEALQRILGVQPAFMRPPYGSFNDNVREVSAARGQKIAIWDFDSGDSNGSTSTVSKRLYREKIAENPSNILALNHDVHGKTAGRTIPYAIEKLQAAGYELVTVAECLNEEPYQWVSTPGTKDSSWQC